MRSQILCWILFFLLILFVFKVNYALVNIQNDEELANEFKNLGKNFFWEKNYNRALESLKEALRLNNDDFEIYFYLGCTYYNTAKWDDAIAAYNLARFQNPQFDSTYYHLGLTYKDIRRPNMAVRQLRLALQHNPNYYEAAYYLGLTYYIDLGNKREAIKYFNQAIAIKPDYIEACKKLGEIYFVEKEYDEVIAILTNVIDRTEQDANVFYYLGAAYYYKRDHYEEVITDSLHIRFLNNATTIDPSHKNAFLLLGKIYFEYQNFARAIEEYERVLIIEPGNKIAIQQITLARDMQKQIKIKDLFAQGSSLFNQMRWEESIPLFEQILSINPNHGPAIEKKEEARSKLMFHDLYEKGVQANREGETEKAMLNLQQALKFTKNENEIENVLDLQKELAHDLEENVRKQNAVKFFEEGLEDYRSRDYSAAVDNFKIALTFDPTRTDIQKKIKETCYTLAQDEKKRKNWNISKYYLEQLLKFSPDSSEKKLVEKELKEIEGKLKGGIFSHFSGKIPLFLSGLSALGLIFIGYFGYKRVNKVSKEFRKSKELRETLSETKYNPYISGQPVYDENFFIHMKPSINSMLRGIHANSYLIIGDYRSGKTSLLHFLKQKIEKLNDHEDKYKFIPFFLDTQQTSEDTLFLVFARELLKEVKNYIKIQIELHITNKNRKYTSQDFKFDIQSIISILSENNSKQAILVFLVDELNIMNDYSDATKSSFRSIFTEENSNNLKVIATATDIKDITSEGSPWCNFFIEEKMNRFSKQHAKLLIEEPVQGIFTYEKEAIVKIVEYTNGEPKDLQEYCRRLVDRAWDNGKDIITADDVVFVHKTIPKGVQND